MLRFYDLELLSKENIHNITLRNTDDTNTVTDRVKTILEEVKKNGDTAIKKFTTAFDKVDLNELTLEREQLNIIAASVNEEQKSAINLAYRNIWKFHESQIKLENQVETTTGVICWRESRPIENVGIYIPGGTAVLPSTLMMLAIPAKIAGCKNIVVCTPPDQFGNVNPYIAYVAQLLDINEIYLCGGAQAIAAMAYGTVTIPKVDKIFGPGNQYVTKAKTLLQSITGVAIDMPAGPSEVLVIADENSNPDFVAADLLAQLEHGVDSQAVLVSTSKDTIDKINNSIARQISVLERMEIAKKALELSYAIVVKNLNEAVNFSNLYAPEHLILSIENWKDVLPKISNAGSVFLGGYTPESAGDYASGTNHTLPTSAFARSYSGVSVDSFVKKITFQHISQQGLKNIGPSIEILAEIEGLQAHKNSVTIRLNEIDNGL